MVSQPDCFHIERIDYLQANRFPVESTQGIYTYAAHTTGLPQQVETRHHTRKAGLPGVLPQPTSSGETSDAEGLGLHHLWPVIDF